MEISAKVLGKMLRIYITLTTAIVGLLLLQASAFMDRVLLILAWAFGVFLSALAQIMLESWGEDED
jgi:hypothetical protein